MRVNSLYWVWKLGQFLVDKFQCSTMILKIWINVANWRTTKEFWFNFESTIRIKPFRVLADKWIMQAYISPCFGSPSWPIVACRRKDLQKLFNVEHVLKHTLVSLLINISLLLSWLLRRLVANLPLLIRKICLNVKFKFSHMLGKWF